MTHNLKSGIYLHYTGLIVLVIGTARHSETEEHLVAYIPLAVKEKPRITVRPYEMFFEEVEIDGIKKSRFKYIGEEMPLELAKEYSPFSK
jgi:cyclomaltodextrinase